MNLLFRQLRPLLISVAVLILTAGIAFAAKPSNPGNGHPGDNPVTTLTETTETETAESETETETETSTTTSETSTDTTTTTTTTSSSDTSGNCSVDPTTATPEVLATLNHGQIVCWAAHQPTPDGYANHGAWVSQWAKGNHGSGHAPVNKGHSS